MASRVYLHIGLPKTGTTFLQTAMWHNRDRLRSQSFLYPGRKRMDHYHASRVVRGASPAVLGKEADTWSRLVRELEAWQGAGLVSHEFFSMATPAQAASAVRDLQPAEVHVVVTARDYVRQFPAVWQEALKMNSDLGLDAFMERAFAGELSGAWGWRSQDLPAVLRRWSTAVPAERLHLVTVPPPSGPRDLLWQRWCQVLGIDDSDFDMDLSFSNESLGAPQAALMLRVKPHLSGPLQQGPERHRWVRAYFGHQVLGPQRGPRFGLRPDHAQALAVRARTDVQAISAAGYQVHGDLEDLVPAEQPALAHPDDVRESEVLEVAGRAIEQMIRDVRRLTKERDSWRRRAQQRSRPPRGVRARLGRVRGRLARRLGSRLGRSAAGRSRKQVQR